MQTGRSKALSMLIQTGKEAGYSHLVLENGRKKSSLSSKEENLCMFLYRGVLERKITLDYRLAPYLNPKNPPQEEAMWLLRLGLFQILYAPRIPDHVAVSQTAEAAKKAGYPRLVGLCNGVLRAFLRDGGAKSEKLPDDPVERISILGSLDKSLARLLFSQMGEEKLTAYLLRSFEKKPVWFRVNLLKISEENCYQKLEEAGFSVEKGPLFASFTTPDTAALIHHCVFTDGLVFVQDLAAQMAAAALGAEVGDLVADVCAAPGTKTVALAGMMANKGEILAGELHPHRLAKLKEAAEKMGALIIHPVCRDASLASEEEKDAWDKVLVDAPCSGLGTLAGNPKSAGRAPNRSAFWRKSNKKSCIHLPSVLK